MKTRVRTFEWTAWIAILVVLTLIVMTGVLYVAL